MSTPALRQNAGLAATVILVLMASAAGRSGRAAPRAQTGDYGLAWWSVDGGGGESRGGAYALHGTAGQADAGSAAGAGYRLDSGFWAAGRVAAPSATPSATATEAPSATATATATPTPPTATQTAPPTATTVSTDVPSPVPDTATPTATSSATPSPTAEPSPGASPEASPTATVERWTLFLPWLAKQAGEP